MYLTQITKQILQIVFFWHGCLRLLALRVKENQIPGRNPPVHLGDHVTILHADLRLRVSNPDRRERERERERES